jgi:hypothetical protein
LNGNDGSLWSTYLPGGAVKQSLRGQDEKIGFWFRDDPARSHVFTINVGCILEKIPQFGSDTESSRDNAAQAFND